MSGDSLVLRFAPLRLRGERHNASTIMRTLFQPLAYQVFKQLSSHSKNVRSAADASTRVESTIFEGAFHDGDL
jgi:hypothetical protein